MRAQKIGAAERILAMEEENKRFNSEKDILLSLAPDRWIELKDAFKNECNHLSQHSHRLQFECEEPELNSFRICRFFGEVSAPAADFIFNPQVPRITFEIHLGKPLYGGLNIRLAGNTAIFADGNSGVILGRFVTDIMFRITR